MKKDKNNSEASESYPLSYPLLDQIASPLDLRNLSLKQLEPLCQEIRDCLITTLAETGGHFASNLGVVELTAALHYVYNTPDDRLIWDVGHQIYPHKMLTGRRKQLKSVRQTGGISGFPRREESIYDIYNTGHAGTSISQLLGEAIARDRQNKSHKCVCVIGDASITSGMALEALNHGGQMKTACLVILNDNNMSISANVGALSQYLKRFIRSRLYEKLKRLWYSVLMNLPIFGSILLNLSFKLEMLFVNLFIRYPFFQALGFRCVGPVDGHDIISLVKVLAKLRVTEEPTLLHVYTNKGHGYKPAELNPIRYHSVSVFNRNDGSFIKEPAKDRISFSQIVGESLLDIATRNSKVIVISPAMVEGSGLRKIYDTMPSRVFDVGIAEQHSISFAGALAATGMIPYLCIYSTFLNRGIDQLIQDIALMNLPVRLIIDRAGCVGPDGETHQGLYDLGLLLAVPNIQVYAPASGSELKAMLYYMESHNHSPLAIRFPKAECLASDLAVDFNSEFILSHKAIIDSDFAREKHSLGIIAVGAMWNIGLTLKKELARELDLSVMLIGLRWIRPLDLLALEEALKRVDKFIIIEDSYLHSSAAAYLLQLIQAKLLTRHLHTFAFPESPIEHGKREDILEKYGLSVSSIMNFLQSKLS